jgi:(p)ppGpp synthase/HD superfamily hydrolase
MQRITHEATRKAISHLRSRLLGAAMENRDWYRAVAALEYAIEKHDGMMRKDGITPYILHPVQVANHIMTLPDLERRVTAVCVGLTHDIIEDCGVTYQMLASDLDTEIADGTEVMSKEVDGIKKPTDIYMKGLGLHIVGSIAKPSDRFNNQSTMAGTFSLQKAVSTVEFTREWILPMVKVARRRFPTQELAYENLKVSLNTQIDLVLSLQTQWGLVQQPS